MNIIKRGDPVVVNCGQHHGKRGNVVGLIVSGSDLMVEVNIVGEPQTTFHRLATLSKDYEKR